MKRNSPILLILLVLFAFVSCSKPIIFEEKVIFPNANWAFENKAVTFTAPIKGTDKPCKVTIELELTGALNVELINTAFTVISPKGAKAIKSIVFNFKTPQEPYIIKKSENKKIYTLTVYPKRFFSETGDYTFEINQFSNKADNYGIHSLSLRIEKVKE
jgi:hypothetical protein